MISNEYKMHKNLRVKTNTYTNITFSSTDTVCMPRISRILLYSLVYTCMNQEPTHVTILCYLVLTVVSK